MSPSPSATRGWVSQRDARQRAARLALAAGDQHQQVVVRHVVDIVFGQERRQVAQIAAFARGGIDVAQRAADQRDAAPGVVRGQRDRFHPRDVAGEAGDGDAAASGRGSAPTGCGAPRASLPEWPSTIALVESQTIASTPRSPSAASAASSVGGPISGVGSSFQSPVCSSSAVRRVDHQRLRLRDRVRHADELQRERRQVERAAGRHDVQLDLLGQLRPRPACGAAPRRRTASHRPGTAAAATARRTAPM